MSVRVSKLSTNFSSDIIGLPAHAPLLTWAVEADEPGLKQSAYQISVDGKDGDVVKSSDSIEVPAPGSVSDRQIVTYRVRVETQKGWSDYSAPVTYEAGLKSGADFVGEHVGDDSSHSSPSPLLRKEFAAKKVAKARLYIASEGLHDVYINGVHTSNEYLTPGWTAYDDRRTYLTYDVTGLINEGTNALAIELGDGWTRGKLGFTDKYDNYNSKLSANVLLEMINADGSKDVVVTDKSWKTSTGEVQFGDIYDGCTIDLNKSQKGWKLVGFNDSSWSPVTVHAVDKGTLYPRISPKIKKVQEFPAVVLDTNNRALLDFTQNISGWVRLTVDGKKGDIVTIRHAEVLEPGLKLHTKALRSAKATDVYTLDRDGRHVLEPRFTFHGFQFAEVTGSAKFISAVGIAISSAHIRRGYFSSSDARLNRLHENVVWSIADNMVSLPTDCPQRDERLGWTGDAQAISMAANTIYELGDFWRSWLVDLDVDQQRYGGVGAVVPDILQKHPSPAPDAGWEINDRAGWADAATIVPMAAYISMASKSTMKQQLRSIRQYIDDLSNRRAGAPLLPTSFQFGDWCDPDAPSNEPWKSKVSADFVANAFFANTAQLAADIEGLVGEASYQKKFAELAQQLRTDIWKTMGEEAKTTTAGCSITLEFNICPESERAEIGKILAKKVLEDEGRIRTGFLGTPLILHALSKSGHFDAAYTMLMRRKVMSWLYQVDQKATTIWERWDAIREDGSIHSGEMNTSSEDQPDASMISFNHYAYGAVIDWVYRNVAGIAPAAPGYREITFAPRPAEGFTFAEASVETLYGCACIDWSINSDGLFAAKICVPFGTTATVDLPVTSSSQVHINGAKAANGASVGYGEHTITVTSPAVISYHSA